MKRDYKMPITQIYRNKKNHKECYIIGFAIDCTNARDGSRVVIYKTDDALAIFVRDEKEFFEKFEALDVGFRSFLESHDPLANVG